MELSIGQMTSVSLLTFRSRTNAEEQTCGTRDESHRLPRAQRWALQVGRKFRNIKLQSDTGNLSLFETPLTCLPSKIVQCVMGEGVPPLTAVPPLLTLG